MAIDTNLQFKSNLQPVNGDIKTDAEFHKHIYDFDALNILKNYLHGRRLSPAQNEELRQGAHCAKARRDNYPWGTIIDGSGRERVVCRCFEVNCKFFQDCRPDFSEQELEVFEDNNIEHRRIEYAEAHRQHVAVENVVIEKKPEPVTAQNTVLTVETEQRNDETTSSESSVVDNGREDTDEHADATRPVTAPEAKSGIGGRPEDERFRRYLELHEPAMYKSISLSDFYDIYGELVKTAISKKNDYLELTSEEVSGLLSYIRQSKYFRMQHRKDLVTVVTVLGNITGFREENGLSEISKDKQVEQSVTSQRTNTVWIPDGFQTVLADIYGSARVDEMIGSFNELIIHLQESGRIDKDDTSENIWGKISDYMVSIQDDPAFEEKFATKKMMIQNVWRRLQRYLPNLKRGDNAVQTDVGRVTETESNGVAENTDIQTAANPVETTAAAQTASEDDSENIRPNSIVESVSEPVEENTPTVDLSADRLDEATSTSAEVEHTEEQTVAATPVVVDPSPAREIVGQISPGGASAATSVQLSRLSSFDDYYRAQVGASKAEERLAIFEEVYAYLQSHGMASHDEYSVMTAIEAAELSDCLLDTSLMNWQFSENELECAMQVFNYLGTYLRKKSRLEKEAANHEKVQQNATVSSETSVEAKAVIDDGTDTGLFHCVEQRTIIQLDPSDQTFVNAGPGTGKTWTLIEKVVYMVNDLEVDPENILILCYSRAAVDVVKNRMQTAVNEGRLGVNWSRIDIRTFDSYSTWLIAQIMESAPELLPDGYTLQGQSYDDRIRTATGIIRDNKDLLVYSHAIVDEVQDLVGSRAELVLTILSALPQGAGFTIFGDYCQALYDYQVKNGGMSSEQFYDAIKEQYPNANYYALVKNHRQDLSFTRLINPYRQAILSGSKQTCDSYASELFGKVQEFVPDIRDVTYDAIQPYLQEGTVAVLTRSNAQALLVSERFKAERIRHQMQHSMMNTGLGEWIARVFQDYENASISEEIFLERFHELYPNVDAADYWNAILSTQGHRDRSWFDVEDILKGIYTNAKDPLLYESSPGDENSDVVISTIHRAKGREYDTVIILDDLLNGQNKDEDDTQEHKVRYVALTRPRKNICRVGMSDNYIYRADDGRCYKSGKSKFKKKKPFLARIEIKDMDDLDETSFAENADRQEYIRHKIRTDVDIELKFTKNEESAFEQAPYCLSKMNDSTFVIGTSSKGLRWGISDALCRLWEMPSISYSGYPIVLNSIAVDRKITCISPKVKELPGATAFGDMYIWTGLSLSGMATNDLSRLS